MLPQTSRLRITKALLFNNLLLFLSQKGVVRDFFLIQVGPWVSKVGI
jgi:hypothetical protein